MSWLPSFFRRPTVVIRRRDWRPAMSLVTHDERSDPYALLERGSKAFRADSTAEAHVVYSLAFRIAKRRRDRVARGRALTALADLAMHFCPDYLGDPWTRRASLSEDAVEILRDVGDAVGLSRALVVRASCRLDRDGKDDLEESLDISKREGDTQGVVRACSALAANHSLHGDEPQAIELSRQAIQLARVLGDAETLADALFSRGLILPEPASDKIAACAEAAMLYGKLRLKKSQLRCLLLSGLFRSDGADLATQREYLLEMLPLAREVAGQSPCDLSRCLDHLVDVERALGNNDMADAYAGERAQLPTIDDESAKELLEEFGKALDSEGAIAGAKAFERWCKAPTDLSASK